MQEVKSLMAINAPLTFSIIPGLGKGREVAEAAHARNHEVMLPYANGAQGLPATAVGEKRSVNGGK